MVDERTERLITRRLDGELTESESLELDKLLIRDPDSRALLERQQRLDALARDTLHDILGQGHRRSENGDRAYHPVPFTPVTRGTRIRHWGLSVATAAAALALMVVTGQMLWPTVNRETRTTADAQDPRDPQALVENTSPDAELRHPGERGREVVPAMPAGFPGMRDMVGVFDEETESLYLLEMPRPTGKSPARASY